MVRAAKIFTMIGVMIFAVLISCTRSVQDAGQSADESKDIAVEPAKKYDLDRKYLKEGFISRDVFRVVIVEDKNVAEAEVADVKDRAKKRSLATLQKYLQMNNKAVTQNVNAELLNMINDVGNLTKKDDISDKHSVFYFDVEKSNIRRYIDTITAK